jgi:hypothetical protein
MSASSVAGQPAERPCRAQAGQMRAKVRRRIWYWVALAGLASAAAVAACASQPARPAQFTLQMTPVTALTKAACVSEAESHGYSASAGVIICRPGEGMSWYRAALTNHGPYGYPACTATSFDSAGRAVFAGRLFFGIGGVTGLFVPGHRTVTFDWYLPHKTSGPVARYMATCSAVPQSQWPI